VDTVGYGYSGTFGIFMLKRLKHSDHDWLTVADVSHLAIYTFQLE